MNLRTAVRGCLILAWCLAGCTTVEGPPAGNAAQPAAVAKDEPLIPRTVLFGNPQRAGLNISPDGTQISFLAPVDGVMNVWVAPRERPNDAKAVTHDKVRGVRNYSWAFTNQHILYTQDQGGDENWNVHAVDLASGGDRNLTPNPKVAARIVDVSDKFPDEIVVALNDRDPQHHDLHRINLRSGADTLLAQNPGKIGEAEVADMIVDSDYRLRFAVAALPSGGQEIFKPAAPSETTKATWESFTKIPFEDGMTTAVQGFDRSGQVLYLADSRDRNTSALFALDLGSGAKKLLAEDLRADLDDVLVQPREHTAQAAAFDFDRKRWKVLDPAVAGDLEYLKSVADGDFRVTSRSLDDKLWTVAYLLDDGPVRYYVYDRGRKKADFLFTNNPALEHQRLAKMHPVVIKSRDGLEMMCYYTLPADAGGGSSPMPRAQHPLPMVLSVHGGPWGRDTWGYDPFHQWFANRGYAVLSVNFRGSTGLGKAYTNAGNREWGGKMHDDLIDAVNWAVAQRIADPKRIAIMGGSYGGYATLVGLTFTPDVFACGVDVVGPSRLLTLMATIPPYWAPALAEFRARIGDNTTEEGKAFLESRSPLTYADRITKPLLIAQGANDPRVKQAEADQIVRAMQDKGIPVTYVLYSDEGHGFARPENRLSFSAVAEAFLAQCLGGRAEPIGSDFAGSTIDVRTGAGRIPGLAAKLAAIRSATPPTTRPALPAAGSGGTH
jgi:dipeptidyl aminopeptidase/acylaminoacyl peptidase